MSKKQWKTFDPCACCGAITENGNCEHHIITRKARRDLQNEPWNRVPSCQKCHNMHHTYTFGDMIQKNIGFRAWLLLNDWYYCNLMQKWWHDKINHGSDIEKPS